MCITNSAFLVCYSQPVRKTCAPFAMLTPFLPYSDLAPTNPASEYNFSPLATAMPSVFPISPVLICGAGLTLYRACINQHLMNNKDCFFCKATITGVEDYEKPPAT